MELFIGYRMLVFAWPMMVGFAAGVAVVGAVALWRGRWGIRRVSSTKLWQGLAGEASGGKTRWVDPVWLVILLGGVLLALAASGPGWRARGESPAKPRVEWSVRSVGSGQPELFVRVGGETDGFSVEGDSGERTDMTTKIYGEASAAEARAGKVVTLSIGEGQPDVSLRLRAGRRVLRRAMFVQPVGGAFGLLTQTGRGRWGAGDAALYRVFAVNPAARVGDASVAPQVLLVDDARLETKGIGDKTLLLISPTTAVEGIEQTGEVELKDATPVNVAMPAFVRLEKVHVKKMMGARLSEEWKVMATVDGRPWVAVRHFGENGRGGPVGVWTASQAVGESDWAGDASFPLFFTDLLATTFPGQGAESASAGAIRDWEKRETNADNEAANGKIIGLSRWAAGAGIAFLLLGMSLLLRRGR